MSASLRPRHLEVYRDVARLLLKHGSRDLVDRAGLGESLGAVGEGGPGLESRPEDRDAAEELAADLEAMGPTFIKLGQILSTRADLLPAAYLDALSRLQDDVAAFSFEEVEAIIRSELGVRVSKAFTEFDREPLAAASLAQVHAARLRDGRRVAVKVQRPDVRERVLTDLEALEVVAERLDRHTDVGAHFHFVELLDEFRRTLLRELDYQREARNLTTLGENLSDYERIVVPAPVEDLTTTRVLTMDLVEGRELSAMGQLGRTDVEGSELAEELFRAYLDQVLNHGFLHADPHPGNIFIVDDGSRLALVDVGMVAHVAPETREHLLQLLIAITDGDIGDAVRAAKSIGHPTGQYDEPTMRREIADLVMRYNAAPGAAIQVGAIVMEIARISGEAGLRPPPEISLLAKTLLNLDDVGRTLDPDFDPNAAIRRSVAELATSQMWQSISPSGAFGAALDMKEFVEKLPGRVNRITEAIANGELTVNVDSFDEDRLIGGLYQVANRIATGLILAALIIGAAMLMGVETDRTFFGYPALAMVFFLIAAVGGLALVISIALGGERRRRR